MREVVFRVHLGLVYEMLGLGWSWRRGFGRAVTRMGFGRRCGAQRFERRGSAERWARSILLEIVRGGDLRLRSLRSFSTL